MPNNLGPTITTRTSTELRTALLPTRPLPGASVDLVLTIDDRDLNLRDLSRFLQLLDRSYGRLSAGELRSYARERQSQLRISKIEKGSWEVVLTQALSIAPDPTPILLLYLLLKFMPKAVESSARSIERLATAYNSYEQGRLARENRRKLRAEIAGDQELMHLPPKHRSEVASIVDVLIRDDPSVSNPAQRFSEQCLRQVRVRVRNHNVD